MEGICSQVENYVADNFQEQLNNQWQVETEKLRTQYKLEVFNLQNQYRKRVLGVLEKLYPEDFDILELI